jgi:hypothetical protein
MQIYANKSIRIDESLTTGLRSSIQIFGNVYYGSIAWGERDDLKKLFDELVNWREAVATMTFTRLEESKEQKFNDSGWIHMDGKINFNKQSNYLDLRCTCLLTPEKWTQLKNDLFAKSNSSFDFEFNIAEINSGVLKETDESISSKIELYMESYSIVKLNKTS